MSNPAVILLSQVSLPAGSFRRVKVEDNIGEAIHIHIDNYRIDLTVSDLNALSAVLWTALKELDSLPDTINESGFCSELYSATSFRRPEIIRTSHKISDLKFIKRNKVLRFFYIYSIVGIHKVPQFQYLNCQNNDFLKYPQKNYVLSNNLQRLRAKQNVIAAKKETQAFVPVLFGKNTKVIRDGMHTCAVIAHESGVDTNIDTFTIANVSWKRKMQYSALLSMKSVAKTIMLITKRIILALIR